MCVCGKGGGAGLCAADVPASMNVWGVQAAVCSHRCWWCEWGDAGMAASTGKRSSGRQHPAFAGAAEGRGSEWLLEACH